MLQIIVPEREFFNDETSEFTKSKAETLQLEHSLLSLAKWESKWRKPFLSSKDKTNEETLDYIRCMIIGPNTNPEIFNAIPGEVFAQIKNYINDPMTATWFSELPGQKRNNRIITAEIIYYWMISLNIPMECQKWHLNRLLTLIRVCSIESQAPKKGNRKEIFSRQAAINQARRAKLKSKG